MAVDILDEGYKVDPEKTLSIVTRSLEIWKDYTCADFAVSCKRESFVAHPTMQSIFDELWDGPLTYRIPIYQFLFVLINPFYLMKLTYRSDKTLSRLSAGLEKVTTLKDWSFKSALNDNSERLVVI